MPVDTSMYNALLARPRSVLDYQADYDQADLRKQALQQNALALQQGRLKVDEYNRGLQEQATIRNALMGLGANATDEARISALKGTGLPGGFSQADALEKSILERQKTGAEVDSKKATATKSMVDATGDRLKQYRAQLDMVDSPQKMAVWFQAQYNDPLTKDTVSALGPLEAAVSGIPQDPAAFAEFRQKVGMGMEAHLKLKHDQAQLAETTRGHDLTHKAALAGHAVQVRGQDLVNQRAIESNRLKGEEIAAGGKPPPGYRWVGPGQLEAIPGGPGDKLPEAQQKQVVGVNNLRNAITEYRTALDGFKAWNTLSPDERAKMGTKYQNMLLQAKEAYNLGVLNGPDYQILQEVITSPLGFKGAITSKKALDEQASELDRIMGGVAATSSQRRPQDAPKAAPGAPKVGAVEDGYRFKGGNPRDRNSWEKV